MRITCKSYFSGAGGLDRGLIDADIDVIQSLDIDKTSCDTLRANYSHQVLEKDIREITVTDQPHSHVIALTYPCTKYSAIADIHGTRTGDELFLHGFRHVVLSRPEAFVLENVPGMRKFKVVMECFQKIPDYYVTTLCPVGADNWLPQKRDRLIMIGTRRRHFISPPQINLRRPKLSDLLERDPQVHIPDYVYKRFHGEYRDRPIISNPDDAAALAPTCVAHYSKDVSTRLVMDARFAQGIRPYSVREYARLQGFPDDHVFAGSQAEQYKQIGNAVAVPVGRWIGQVLNEYFNKAA